MNVLFENKEALENSIYHFPFFPLRIIILYLDIFLFPVFDYIKVAEINVVSLLIPLQFKALVSKGTVLQ